MVKLQVTRTNREKADHGRWKFTLEIVVNGKGTGQFVFITTPNERAFQVGWLEELEL